MVTIKVTLRPNTNILADPKNAFVVAKIDGDLDVPGRGDGSHGNVALPGECISREEADSLVSRKLQYHVLCVE